MTHKRLVYGIAWVSGVYATGTGITFMLAPDWPMWWKFLAIPAWIIGLITMFVVLIAIGG